MSAPDLLKLRQDLRRDEGVRRKLYVCTAGKTSIGVGRNLDDVGVSDNEIGLMLESDIATAERSLDQSVPFWRKLPEPAARGLANMVFNMGIGRLLGFKGMLSALEIGDYNLAADEAIDSKWAKQVGERATRIAEQFRSCAGVNHG